MIQGVTPSFYISEYNPLRFVENTFFAKCGDLNPVQTLYAQYINQVQTEIQPYAQPYSYKDRIKTCFYSRYNLNKALLKDICGDFVAAEFDLLPLPNQNIYSITGGVAGGVTILNDPSLSNSSVIKLVTQIVGGILVNGSSTWDSSIGESFVGGSVIITTTENKFIEAEVVSYNNENFDWLELDKTIDLSTFTVVDVTFVSRARADLAYYYCLDIDACDYPESIYQIELQVNELDAYTSTYEKSLLDVSRTAKSECFEVKRDQPNTNLILYKNEFSEVEIQEVPWGYFNLDYFEVRVHSQYLPSQSAAQKNNLFRSSDNIQVVSDQGLYHQHKLQIDYVPWYIHQKLSVALNSDSILVNGLSVILEEDYEVDELTRIGKSKGVAVLSQQQGYIENLA